MSDIDKLIQKESYVKFDVEFIFIIRDNPRFGINDWHSEWDGSPKSYTFGENLNYFQRKKLIKNQKKT